MLMNYYRHIDRAKVQFDFLTHRPYDGDYGEEIMQLGGKIYHLPRLNPFSQSYKQELSRFFKEHPEYQIIHVHQDCLSGVILKVAQKCGIAVRIAHSHSARQDRGLKYPIKCFLRRSISKYATELMACGEEAGKWMFAGADFRIVNNAIDSSQYAYDPQKRKTMRVHLGISENDVVVGHVGRWDYPKNHLFLLDIFNEMTRLEPNARLLLVGNNKGDYANQVADKIRRLQMTDRVIITGLRKDVADMMQAMDVFVFPSIYEGLPLTMVEAQAAGLPCLISDKVPIECKLTKNVQQICLDTSPEIWAERALEAAKKTVRCDTTLEIKAAGFDIFENAAWLQAHYLSSVNKE